VDLVVPEGDVVLVDVVPLLDADLLGARARLRRHQLLEVADGVVLVALDAHLLAETVVQHHLDHLRPLGSSPSLPQIGQTLASLLTPASRSVGLGWGKKVDCASQGGWARRISSVHLRAHGSDSTTAHARRPSLPPPGKFIIPRLAADAHATGFTRQSNRLLLCQCTSALMSRRTTPPARSSTEAVKRALLEQSQIPGAVYISHSQPQQIVPSPNSRCLAS
jgi:hypothetical protein